MLRAYTLLEGDLYFVTTGGGLCRCIGPAEIKEMLEEIHSQTCGHAASIMLHRRIRRTGLYWPDIAEQAKTLHDNCPTCQGTPQEAEVYVIDEE
ncbi:hypothetical protein MKX03_020487, partial [Papaver bracteatum]